MVGLIKVVQKHPKSIDFMTNNKSFIVDTQAQRCECVSNMFRSSVGFRMTIDVTVATDVIIKIATFDEMSLLISKIKFDYAMLHREVMAIVAIGLFGIVLFNT
jgi:hypothetical protein